jgi:hypothetical protein
MTTTQPGVFKGFVFPSLIKTALSAVVMIGICSMNSGCTSQESELVIPEPGSAPDAVPSGVPDAHKPEPVVVE